MEAYLLKIWSHICLTMSALIFRRDRDNIWRMQMDLWKDDLDENLHPTFQNISFSQDRWNNSFTKIRSICCQRYSEQKNWLTKGQILLVGQITVQRTKVNSWEIQVTKLDILSFVIPSDRHSTFFVDLILTLEWVPLSQSVFLLTPILPNSHDSTWLNLK